jgi:hypothetical protein
VTTCCPGSTRQGNDVSGIGRGGTGVLKVDGKTVGHNAYYEKSLTSLWLRNASYPRLGGAAQERT